MSLCFLGLGSNLGDRLANLCAAVAQLREGNISPALFSSVYETSPVGCDGEHPDYLNAVVGVQTSLSPDELVRRVLEIESALGRERPAPNAPRTIDIDVIMAGDAVCEAREATVPHLRMHERLFVLAPLREIARDAVHPKLGRTIDELHSECAARSSERVRLYAPAAFLSGRIGGNYE